MNPEFAPYLFLIIVSVTIAALFCVGLYPEKIPFLVKYYEENDN